MAMLLLSDEEGEPIYQRCRRPVRVVRWGSPTDADSGHVPGGLAIVPAEGAYLVERLTRCATLYRLRPSGDLVQIDCTPRCAARPRAGRCRIRPNR